MKCEKCLNIIEEYFEGELDERTASLIKAHVAGCQRCAKAHDELQREQEMYTEFLSEVKESPALWSAVRAGIGRETATPPVPRTSSWLARPLGNPRFGVAFGLALIILVVSIGLMRHLWTRRSTSPDLTVSSNPGGTTPLSPSPIGSGNPVDRVTSDPQVKSGDQHRTETSTKKPGQGDAMSKHLLLAGGNGRRNNNMKPAQPRQLSPTPSSVEELLARNAETIDAVQKRWKSSSLLDGEIARHLEKSQMMLLSLRNALREHEASTSNLSYEKGLSRELLSKNILLRRNAIARGDVLAENLLSRLEPFLLDVANLEDKPSSTDLQLLGERIREKEIIATLRAYVG